MFTVQRHSCAYCEKPIPWPKIVNVTLLPPPKTSPQQRRKTFKERRSLAMRRIESSEILTKFPKKVPVIVEKSDREKVLPYLDRVKFLVPLDMTMSQFVGIVRARLKLNPSQTFYLMLRDRSVATMSRYVGDIYGEHMDEDGFLYASYAAQEMYGGDDCTSLRLQQQPTSKEAFGSEEAPLLKAPEIPIPSRCKCVE